MKFRFEEYAPIDYQHYQFPYCIYCIKEPSDSHSEIYEKGFLPFTNDLEESSEIFYLARSVRVPLKEHSFKSKQKNIFNKISKVYASDQLKFEVVPKEKLIDNPDFHQWCIDNSKNGFLHEERLEYILSRPYLKDILRISHGDQLLSYIFMVHESNRLMHYWYSFYDMKVDLNDFGKWIFMETLDWAQKQGYEYFYLGTCYSQSAIYKLSLSPATYYFDGSKWVSDIDTLKKRLLVETK